jgi:hypothetical protein
MKTLTDWAERISAGIGVLLILLSVVQKITGTKIIFSESISYFHCANSFFLISIVLYLHYFRHLKE